MEDIIYWLEDEDLANIYTSQYWNNISEEKKKAWWIERGESKKLLKYLDDYGLVKELEDAISLCGLNLDSNNNEIACLGSGTCWEAAVLSKLSNVKAIHGVDISKHRIEILAPRTFDAMKGDPAKLKRYVGSFYNLQFDDNSIDYIFLSQAFHHAQYPVQLLLECNRVLRSQGKIVLIGEHYIATFKYIKLFLKYFLKNLSFEIDPCKIMPPDKTLGDHYYLLYQYKFFFEHLGFDFNYKYDKIVERAIYYGKKIS